MGRLISNMLPRYSATVLALIMVACVMFDIGDGADTAGLEVVDVANAQHHDVATAQRHVAGAPDPTTKEEATAQLGSAKGKGKKAEGKRGSAKGKKAGAAKKKPAKAQGKKSTFQKATAAFKLRLAQKESAKSSAGDCKNLCDSKCGKELEMDEVVALIEIDEERGGASSLAGKQRDANEQQKLDSPGGDEKATAKAQKKQNAKKAETDQVDKALKHAQVIKDKVMRDEAIAATASAQAVAIVKDKAADKRKAVKEATAQAESEAAIAQGKMLQARMAKKEAKLKRSHEADEQKKLIDREVAANREVSKDATKKKAAEKKAEADANAASVQKYADRKVSDTKLKQDNQIEKIMQKAEAKVKIMHSETAGYKKKSAVLDDRLKAVDGSAKSDALKKVEIAKLSDPKSPKNVALARIAKAKKKSQKAQDKLITQTKVKMAVKTLEKQQANAVDADKQAKKVDAQKAKLKKNQADTAKEKAVGKAAAKKVAKDKTKMAKAMKKGTCKAACKAKCKADSKAKKTA